MTVSCKQAKLDDSSVFVKSWSDHWIKVFNDQVQWSSA